MRVTHSQNSTCSMAGYRKKVSKEQFTGTRSPPCQAARVTMLSRASEDPEPILITAPNAVVMEAILNDPNL